MDESTTARARGSRGQLVRARWGVDRRSDSHCFAFQTPYWSSCPHAFRPCPTPSWYSLKSFWARLRSSDDARSVRGDVIEAKCRQRPTGGIAGGGVLESVDGS